MQISAITLHVDVCYIADPQPICRHWYIILYEVAVFAIAMVGVGRTAWLRTWKVHILSFEECEELVSPRYPAVTKCALDHQP